MGLFLPRPSLTAENLAHHRDLEAANTLSEHRERSVTRIETWIANVEFAHTSLGRLFNFAATAGTTIRAVLVYFFGVLGRYLIQSRFRRYRS